MFDDRFRINQDIYWVGYIDWNLRDFHGYSTPLGSTYNSYLILDEEPTLIDTVKSLGCDEMISRIKKLIDPSRIKYIISNHAEMDHSGSIPKLLEICPDVEIICSPKGAEGIKRYFKGDMKLKIVNTGDTLSIGKRELKFILTPMLHWPDSMITYYEEEGTLFSSDIFGQHYASSERFSDDIDSDVVFQEVKKYYANIITPYGARVQELLDKLVKMKIETICPAHGVVWRIRQHIDTIVNIYSKWSSYLSDNRVVIVYDTMWGSTEKIAKRLYKFIDEEGVPVRLVNLKNSHISDIITEIMGSKFLLIGSPVLNNKVLPAMGAFLTYLRGLKPKNRQGVIFGSYGWAKSGFKELEESMEEIGMSLISEGKYFKYLPDETELDSLKDIAVAIKKASAS